MEPLCWIGKEVKVEVASSREVKGLLYSVGPKNEVGIIA